MIHILVNEAMLVVVEPTARSLATAGQIKALAEDIKIVSLFLVGSKVQDDEDRAFIQEHSPGLPVVGYLEDDPRVRQADRRGEAVYHLSPELAQAGRRIVEDMEKIG